MELTADDTLIPLDGFEVVAVPGKGVWIVDDAGNCWHIGGHEPAVGQDNRLYRAYNAAIDGE